MTLHDELAGLAAKATQGPCWLEAGAEESEGWFYVVHEGTACDATTVCNAPNEHDAALIVALRNNLPAILSALNAADEVKRLREALGTIAAGDVPISVSPDLAVRYEKFARAALNQGPTQ